MLMIFRHFNHTFGNVPPRQLKRLPVRRTINNFIHSLFELFRVQVKPNQCPDAKVHKDNFVQNRSVMYNVYRPKI